MKYLGDTKLECAQKKHEFRMREVSRRDEVEAIDKATDILRGDK